MNGKLKTNHHKEPRFASNSFIFLKILFHYKNLTSPGPHIILFTLAPICIYQT